MSEDEMQMTINPLPTVTINPAGPFCPNLPPQTLTGSPSGGTWGGAATGNTFNPMTNGPGTHTVTYSFTNSNGCTGMASMNIVVRNGPEVEVDPDPLAFCESELSMLLTASADNGTEPYMFHWSTPSGTADVPTFNAVVSGAHNVTVTDANGCTDSTAVQVTVYINPVIVINDPGPICGGLQFFMITAAPSGGVFDGDFISPQGDLLPDMIPPGTYTISYSVTDNNGCSSEEFMQYTITAIPEAIAGNNGPVCAGQQIVLTANIIGGGTFIEYLWTGPNGYTSNVQNPTDATVGGEYMLQVTVDDCESDVSTTTVVVHDLPEAIAVNGGPYCNGEVIELMGSTNESGTTIIYSWSGPNGYTSDVQNPINATQAGMYALVVSVDGCVSDTTFTEVEFGTSPDVAATNSGPYCAGDLIALFGNTMTTGTVIAYQWTGPNGYVSIAQNPADAVDPGLYTLVVSVDGCMSAIDSTTVTVNPTPQPVIAGQATFCTGFSSMLNAGNGYTGYLWDDASMNQMREV
jgi:hypothetical protein